jgi:hypothetical protein
MSVLVGRLFAVDFVVYDVCGIVAREGREGGGRDKVCKDVKNLHRAQTCDKIKPYPVETCNMMHI